MRDQKNYREVIGLQPDGTIVILDYTFDQGEWSGAVGVEVYPVSQEMIREAMREKREYLRELADDCDMHGQARQNLYGIDRDEYLEMRYETYRDIPTATIAQAIGTDEPERYTLSAVGRIFPRALENTIVLMGQQKFVDIIHAAEEVATV